MPEDRAVVILPHIRRLVRRKATPALAKISQRTHPADLARVLERLDPVERRPLFDAIPDPEIKAEVMSFVDVPVAVDMLTTLDLDAAVELLREMDRDDGVDLIAELPEDLAAQIIEAMRPSEQEEVEQLLAYPADTAGGIMSPSLVALERGMTAEEAIARIRQLPDAETVYYVYVVNEHGTLVGVASLRQLVVTPPDAKLEDIMNPDVLSVHPEMDQEEVARVASRYGLLAVPVVNATNVLLGVVTIDDVIHVLHEEADEDILKMAGVGEEYEAGSSVVGSWRVRVPWLLATGLGGVAASFLIGFYEGRIAALAAIAAFMPVVLGMSGNVGTQSLTITVRGLATGRIEAETLWNTVGRELLVGTLLGLAYGLLLWEAWAGRGRGSTARQATLLSTWPSPSACPCSAAWPWRPLWGRCCLSSSPG